MGAKCNSGVSIYGYLAMIDNHIGSTNDNMESALLIKKAHMVIELTFQINIFPEQKQ